MKIMKITIWLLAFAGILAGCEEDQRQPVARGNRKAGIHITQAQNNSYAEEIDRVKELGAEVIPLTLPWTFMETGSGFDKTFPELINSYYPAQGFTVSLNITPIYAVSRSLPPDLIDKPFNDPMVITRFKALLDSLHKWMPDANINNFVLGLEVDNYLSSHPQEWLQYKALYDSGIVHVKKLWGASMPVGVETTWGYTVYTNKDEILELNENSDLMVLSYYPNESDFTVKAPSRVHEDIEMVLDLYPEIPTFIVETGYQTSTACNSSEEKQAQFIREMFALWDKHPERINFMGFLWLTDLSDQVTEQYVNDYGLTNFPHLEAFRGYLQTTGLRTWANNGTDKKGYAQLEQELQRRGW